MPFRRGFREALRYFRIPFYFRDHRGKLKFRGHSDTLYVFLRPVLHGRRKGKAPERLPRPVVDVNAPDGMIVSVFDDLKQGQ
jgi:hypothetical protein